MLIVFFLLLKCCILFVLCVKEALIKNLRNCSCHILTKDISITVNDTHREKLCFTQFSTRNGCLAASDLIQMFTQSIKFYTFHCHVLKVTSATKR